MRGGPRRGCSSVRRARMPGPSSHFLALANDRERQTGRRSRIPAAGRGGRPIAGRRRGGRCRSTRRDPAPRRRSGPATWGLSHPSAWGTDACFRCAADCLVVRHASGARFDRRGPELIPVGLRSEADAAPHARIADVVEPELLVVEVLRVRPEAATVAGGPGERVTGFRRQLTVGALKALLAAPPIWKKRSASCVCGLRLPSTATLKPQALSWCWTVVIEASGAGCAALGAAWLSSAGAGPGWVAIPRICSLVASPEYQPEMFATGRPRSEAPRYAPESFRAVPGLFPCRSRPPSTAH